MNQLNIFHTKRGDVHVSDAELREAGIRIDFFPRWTSPDEPRDGMASLKPKKRAQLLLDFLTLFALEA